MPVLNESSPPTMLFPLLREFKPGVPLEWMAAALSTDWDLLP